MLMAILVYCFAQCSGQTHFTRDVSFDNSFIQESFSEIEDQLFQSCARGCHDNMACLSFVFNQPDARCQLFPKIFLSKPSDTSQAGNIMYRKMDEEAVCEIPTSIPNGRLLYIDGQNEGSKAKFICDDFHFSNVPYGQCALGGQWSDLNSPCVYKSGPTYVILSNGRIAVGSCLIIHATPSVNFDKPNVSLKNQGDFIFLVEFRFDDVVVVRNSFNGTWGEEEFGVPYWPLTKGQEANMTLCVEEDLYRFFVDEVEMFTFNHRMQVSDVQDIVLIKMTVRSIMFTDL